MSNTRADIYEPSSYYEIHPETQIFNTTPLHRETPEIIFHRLVDEPHVLLSLSLDELRIVLDKINSSSPSGEIKNAAYKLIQFELFNRYQKGNVTKEEADTVSPFPSTFQTDFDRAPNKAFYMLLLQKTCAAEYQQTLHDALKKGSMKPLIVNEDKENPEEIEQFLQFWQSNDKDQRLATADNSLFYRDQEQTYALQPVFYENEYNIQVSSASNQTITFIAEQKDPDNHKTRCRINEFNASGSSGSRERRAEPSIPFENALNQHLPNLVGNIGHYQACLTDTKTHVILFDTVNRKIANVFKIDNRFALPNNMVIRQLAYGKNKIDLVGITDQETCEYHFSVTTMSFSKTGRRLSPKLTVFRTKEGLLPFELAFDQEYKIGEHTIKSITDISRIKSIAGSSVARIEKRMKTCDGAYSSGGFLDDGDKLLKVLAEDYELARHYNLTYKQIAALISYFSHCKDQDMDLVAFGNHTYKLLGGMAGNPQALPENRRGNFSWVRGIGSVKSPIDHETMSSQDIWLQRDDVQNSDNLQYLFGFASCLAPMIGKYGFFERGFYHFDLKKFIKYLELDATYTPKLAQKDSLNGFLSEDMRRPSLPDRTARIARYDVSPQTCSSKAKWYMSKPIEYWITKWDKNNPMGGDASKATLSLLAEYAGFFKHSPIGTPVAWGGSIGRFFSGRWNTHHGRNVQNAISSYFYTNGSYVLDEKFHNVEFILARVKTEIGDKKMNPHGDLAKILRVIKEKTKIDYESLDADAIFKKYANKSTCSALL